MYQCDAYLIIQCVGLFVSVNDLLLCLSVQAVPSVDIFILGNDRVRFVLIYTCSFGECYCVLIKKSTCDLPALTLHFDQCL